MEDFEFKMKVAKDRKTMQIVFGLDKSKAWTLTAQDAESLISSLSKARGDLEPLVRQSESPLSHQKPWVDALSPRIQCARAGAMMGAPTFVSVAFPGLGWRTFQLDPVEGNALASQLYQKPETKP